MAGVKLGARERLATIESPCLRAGLREVAIENEEFRRLLERLRQETDRIKVQKDYVRLRGFLIASHFTTLSELLRVFSTSSVTTVEVGRFFEQDLPAGEYWACENCGPLFLKNKKLCGIRPTICDDHTPGDSRIRQVAHVPGLMRIRYGIHWRICQPGIPELRLFEQLEQLQEQFPDHLIRVERWPGLDTYDARLEFRDGVVWAIDVKAHVDPYHLNGKLAPIREIDGLRYDEAYYVFPHERVTAQSGYLDIVSKGNPLPSNHQLLSDTGMVARVSDHIAQLKKRRV